jgi:hypothetical protein
MCFKRNRARLEKAREFLGEVHFFVLDQVSAQGPVDRIDIQPLNQDEGWQVVVPVTVPDIGIGRRGQKTLQPIPRTARMLDHELTQLPPLGVVHHRDELLLLHMPAKPAQISFLFLGHESLANDTAVQRRVREGAQRPMRPSVCNGGFGSVTVVLDT